MPIIFNNNYNYYQPNQHQFSNIGNNVNNDGKRKVKTQRTKSCRRSKAKKVKMEVINNQNVNIFKNVRGCMECIFHGYKFAKHSSNGPDKIYWYCRKKVNGDYCNARITTIKRANGLYTINLTRPNHNHESHI